MKNITVKIPDNRFNFFLELVQSLGFKTEEKQEKSPYNPEFVNEIMESRKQYEKGEFISVAKDEINSFLGLE